MASEQAAASQAFDVVTDGALAGKKTSLWNLQGEELDVLDVLDEDAIERAPIQAFFEDGAGVEYYSRTHKRWIPSRVFVRTVPGTLLKEPEVIYSVEARTGARKQVREDVPLNCLRHVFKDGDCVEAFSVRRGNVWVDGHVMGVPSSIGIDVVLDDGQELKRVSPVKVRRRFLDGDMVMVYRGPAVGFVSGEVDVEGFGGMPNIEFGMEVNGNIQSGFSSIPGSELSVDTGRFSGSSGASNTAGAAADGMWSMVPVRVEDENPQLVPSYLLVMSQIDEM